MTATILEESVDASNKGKQKRRNSINKWKWVVELNNEKIYDKTQK